MVQKAVYLDVYMNHDGVFFWWRCRNEGKKGKKEAFVSAKYKGFPVMLL